MLTLNRLFRFILEFNRAPYLLVRAVRVLRDVFLYGTGLFLGKMVDDGTDRSDVPAGAPGDACWGEAVQSEEGLSLTPRHRVSPLFWHKSFSLSSGVMITSIRYFLHHNEVMSRGKYCFEVDNMHFLQSLGITT
jgi:hypothetical protein